MVAGALQISLATMPEYPYKLRELLSLHLTFLGSHLSKVLSILRPMAVDMNQWLGRARVDQE